ncbi:hypothetical protein [Anaeromassilibacillus sp. SJQ-1]|uniref:hypothetical protein n=1 Tax=Anaeromassilibacillus sp. SJQ-1 TaxID=3375419 RepID=UPI00398972B4
MESNASSENTSVPEAPPSQPEVPSQEPEENPDDNIVVVPGETGSAPGNCPGGMNEFFLQIVGMRKRVPFLFGF